MLTASVVIVIQVTEMLSALLSVPRHETFVDCMCTSTECDERTVSISSSTCPVPTLATVREDFYCDLLADFFIPSLVKGLAQ